MIILGHRTIGKVIHTDSFICPNCGNKQYELIEYKRYFTAFFITLFPLVKVGDQVVCISCKTAFVPESILPQNRYQRKAENNSTQETKASIVKRALSFIVDNIIVMILSVLAGELSKVPSSTLTIYLLYSSCWLIYGTTCEMVFAGKTIGKLLFYIRTKKANGSRLDLTSALGRNVVKSLLLFFTMPILALTMLVREDRKSIHDILARTNVFENS